MNIFCNRGNPNPTSTHGSESCVRDSFNCDQEVIDILTNNPRREIGCYVKTIDNDQAIYLVVTGFDKNGCPMWEVFEESDFAEYQLSNKVIEL